MSRQRLQPGPLCRYLAILLLAIGQSASASVPDSQTLLYSVHYNNHDAGKLEVVIESTDNAIRTITTSHLSGLARLFLSEQTIETWYSIDENTAVLERSRLSEQGGEQVAKGYLVDRDNGIIRFLTTEDQPILKDDLLDSSDFPILLMTTEMTRVGGMTIRELTPEKSRYYIYETPVEEEMELNGKVYRTWKVVRNKRSEADRSVTVWLDAENRLVPLRIVSTKREKSMTLTLLDHPQADST